MFKIFSYFIICVFLSVPSVADDTVALPIVEEVCQHCHGLEGEASNVLYPRLAGQHQNYINKQLHDFRSGDRQGDMNDFAKNLSDSQIESLAAYFSQKPVLKHKVRNKEFSQVGWYIFHKGNKYSSVPACSGCHGDNGEGTDSLPRLAGQHKRYIEDQLNMFHTRERTNDNAIMHSIAAKLTEMETAAVALYISGLK